MGFGTCSGSGDKQDNGWLDCVLIICGLLPEMMTGGFKHIDYATFINFVVPGTDGLLLTSTPVITANWETSTNRWTVPLGGGAGYLIRVKEFSF